MLPVNAICRVIAVSLAAALTGCDTEAFYISYPKPSRAIGYVAKDSTLGYAFTVSSPIRVTQLGFSDPFDWGLLDPHAVAIWTSTGRQLVQTTIPGGSPGKLIDGFRYLPIAPFILSEGRYTIGAYTPSTPLRPPDVIEDWFLFDATITSAYEVSYLGPRSVSGGGFRFPSGNDFGRDRGFFGPNFWFTCGDPTQPPTLCRPMIRPRAGGPRR
jgi:hypothetical protein